MNRHFKEFDILDYPLNQGKVLIEAAAGSGKTYTIQYLFLRLLLERDDLEAGNILVVTFTEAATEELKARVRAILKDAARLLDKVARSRPLNADTDGDLGRVLIQALGKGKSIAELKGRLQRARATFDEVVIATIHGFCHRILNDYAFECGTRPDLELVKDSRFFLQIIAEDYWRRTFYNASATLVETVLAKKLTPEILVKLGLLLDRDANLLLLPERPVRDSWAADIAAGAAELETLQLDFHRHSIRAYDYLSRDAAEIERILFAGTPLKGNSWKKALTAQYLAELEAVLANPVFPEAKKAKIMVKFSQSDLSAKTKKKCETPQHPLFRICDELAAAVTRREELAAGLICSIKRDFLDFALGPTGLKLCKEKTRKQGYSDFLTGLSQVLEGPAGSLLKRLVAARFKVALVDEFQDTDPLQNSIFTAFFDRPGALFYRIGDPKQSIYGFRGADIYAYLAAAREDSQELATLDKNYRSTPELLNAFNRIFSSPVPFLLDGIDYRKMSCGRPRRQQEQLLVDGRRGAALHLWHFAGAAGANLTAGSARYRLTAAVADACAELLAWARQPFVREDGSQGWRAEICGAGALPRPLRASDIAVLTASNNEAAEVWQVCQSRGVPAVVAAAGNLWETPEAEEIFRFLEAVLLPGDDNLLSSALASNLLGFSARFLATAHAEAESEEKLIFELWRQAFFHGRELWTKRGVMALFAGFPDFSAAPKNPVENFSLSLNLAGTARGERALTNFYHLQEVLHEYESEHRAGPEVLLNWLLEHLTGAASDADEFELRLESEAETVKIMTVHKSKGLEFPVVFVPFLWKKAGGVRVPELFHRPLSPTGPGEEAAAAASPPKFVRCLDLNPEIAPESRQAAQTEALAEALRLFYVAVTRAKLRLYLAWPQTKDSGKSALMYLRRPPRNPAAREAFVAGGDRPPSLELLDDERAEIWEDIPDIIRESPSFTRAEPLVGVIAAVPFTAREFTRKLPAKSGLMSFSSLTAGDYRPHIAASPALNKSSQITGSQRSLPPLAGFPGGVATGNAIHKIFEELDFSRVGEDGWSENSDVQDLVRKSLLQFDLLQSATGPESEKMVRAVLTMVAQVLNTPLPGGRDGLKLSQADIALRRELEFWLPVAGSLTAARISGVLAPAVAAALRLLEPETVRGWQLQFPENLPGTGFLNGFIDLIFRVDERYYLLDWKTNYLGDDYSDYNQRALQQNMLESDYILQYHIYLVALHRFLNSRLEDYDYAANFGGVYYLYVRGINGENSRTGIFYDRPEFAVVRDLERVICGALRK